MLKKLHYTLLLIVVLCSTVLYAQEKSTLTTPISSDEVTTFIKVYEYKLNHPFDIATSLQKAVQQTTLSEERMTTLLTAQFNGNDIQLTTTEKEEFEKIKAIMEKDRMINQVALDSFITKNKMKLSRYEEIENYFHNNDSFQNKVAQLYNQKTN
ncbi:MAG: hypothetical protein CMP76_04180 [Flavobacterium sp.]|uniref:hypothetical protein n=1 Tax=Flavobacterium sp. TaxID=239 RepID=UPI000C448D58|nr:hypothetical protein [Flavobacterium sp.]MBF02475.1 hypothetical protein [Flavobacterium sp.]|tara:strand:- start:554 stop:1015 length:462 start_codon:yes stop_codon:yes gene_type:complete